MIVVFLLCMFAGVSSGGQPVLDVCGTCHTNATCDDKSDGSGKVCNCKYGFVGNGRSFCQDKNECLIGVQLCGHHTTCHNTYGSYYCTCLAGYSPSNNKTTFIPNDGTHCQDIDECRITGLCGDGAQCRNLEGSFDCSCQVGYKVQDGAEPFHPMRDNASCKVLDCGPPVPAEDSLLLSLSGTTFSSVAVFGCDEGFVWRSGDNSSVCGADGLWRGPTLVCEEVDCGSPPVLPHTNMLWNKRSRMGAEAVYSCNSGYHNVGKGNISVCTAAGLWDKPSVLCQEISCGRPPVIESTEQVWNSNSTPGSFVLYFCKRGFYYNGGQNVSICGENGQWIPPTLSCQEVLCGDPPVLPHSGQMWNGSSTPGSTMTYYCKTGFYHDEGNGVSMCTVNGYWTKADISCKEVSCGEPVFKAHARILWDGTSHIASVAFYQCEEGYHSRSLRNYSVCGENGLWEEIDLWCEEISCGAPLTLPHTNLLWNNSSSPGSVVMYECMDGFYQDSGNNISSCSLSGQWQEVSVKCKAKCGPVPFIANSEVVWHNRSVVIHRCVPGYHSWRGSNVSLCGSSGAWKKAALTCIEIKPPINNLFMFNENCLRWKAEKYEEDTEVYKVSYSGSRDFQRSFHDKRRRFLSTKAERLELCLNLLPVTNYSISITATTARFTASITTNTSLPAPPAPVIHYREFETPLPTLRLHRSASSLDPISVYQVFVLPVEEVMMFDCSSPDVSSQTNSPASYITAQFDVQDVGTDMNFTVGDEFVYGGVYNTALQSGSSYYIVLRAVSRWRTALKSSCVLWAKVRGTSYVLKVSSLAAVALIGLLAVVLLGTFTVKWCWEKTRHS